MCGWGGELSKNLVKPNLCLTNIVQKQLITVRIINIYAFSALFNHFGAKNGQKTDFLDMIFSTLVHKIWGL